MDLSRHTKKDEKTREGTNSRETGKDKTETENVVK